MLGQSHKFKQSSSQLFDYISLTFTELYGILSYLINAGVEYCPFNQLSEVTGVMESTLLGLLQEVYYGHGMELLTITESFVLAL